MYKLLKILFAIFIVSGCAYEPVLLKKNYDFYFTQITSEGESKINKIIIENFKENTKISSVKKYQIFFSSKKNKKVIASNKKGDPQIYKIDIILAYNVLKNDVSILNNEILKQATYDNIDDKFELLKYEESIIKNLSKRFADDILISIEILKE